MIARRLSGGQEEEAVVEARAAGRGLLLAVFVGGHGAADLRRGGPRARRARQRMRTQSPRSQHGPVAEDVAARRRRFYRGCAARPRTMARISRPMRPGQRACRAARRTSIIARARCALEGHEVAASARRRGPAAISLSVDAEPREVLLRQVDAALRPVDGDVLPEVDELQARADGVGIAQVAPGRPCGRVQQQAPDRIGRAARSSPSARRRWRSASSRRPGGRRRGGRGGARWAGRGPRSRRAGARTPGRRGRSPRSIASRRARVAVEPREALGVGRVALVGDVVGARARSRRWPRPAAAGRAEAARRRRGSSRSARPARGSGNA